MKKASKLLWVLLALLLAATFGVLGCGGNDDDGGDDGTGGGGGGGITAATVKGSADWQITKGDQNTFPVEKMKIEGAKEENGNGILKVTWGASADFKMCELYALLPATTDYGQYDGITCKVYLPHIINMLALIRIPNGGTTYKVDEPYIDGGVKQWLTIKFPFSKAEGMVGWGTPAPSGAIAPWLTSTASTQKQINLNPELNIGGGGAINVETVLYLDDIGFYKGTADTIIWKFDVE